MRRFISRRLAIAVLAACLAPCITPPAHAAGALQTVRPGQLTIAYRTDDKPASFINNGQPDGFIVDFENAIGKELGLKIVFIGTDFPSMVPGVNNGRYDSAAFEVIETPQRQSVVNFTSPITFDQARLVSRQDAPIADVDGASGKTVAITTGSALIPILKQMAPGVSVREFPNIAASLNALKARQVDGLFTGLAAANHLITANQGLTESQIVTTGVAAFPVSKSNPGLLAAYNQAIHKLMLNGTYTSLFQKWYQSKVLIPTQLYDAYPGMPRLPASAN